MKQKIFKIAQILLVFLLFSLVIINVYSIANQTVYITKSGSKYHRDGCQYLSSSKIAIDLDEAISKGYKPCSKCNAPTISDTSTNTTNNIATNTSSKQTLREHLIEQNKLEEALSYMYSDAPKSSNTSSNNTTSNSENELNHIEIIYYILIFATIIIFIIIIIAIIKKNKGKKNEQK